MNTMEQKNISGEPIWFYEKNGQRIGGVFEAKIVDLINNSEISYGTPVWKQGYPEWLNIENTELRTHLQAFVPPPLVGEHVNNTIVWVLAFAPLIGLLLQYFVSGMIYSNSNYLAEKAVIDGQFWYVTLILNIGLCIWDANRLKKAGTDTRRFKGWQWVVPVYLFQRAKILKHNKAYFIVWIVSFVLSLAPLE